MRYYSTRRQPRYWLELFESFWTSLIQKYLYCGVRRRCCAPAMTMLYGALERRRLQLSPPGVHSYQNPILSPGLPRGDGPRNMCTGKCDTEKVLVRSGHFYVQEIAALSRYLYT